MINLAMDSNFKAESRENVEQVCNAGITATLIKATTNDEFGEPTANTTLDVKAFPVRYSPFPRSVQNKVAWSQEVDVILYIAKKTQDDAGRTINDLKKYGKMTLDKKRFDITYVDRYMASSDDHLYYIIGGKKA